MSPQVGFKGFHIAKEKQDVRIPLLHCGQEYQLAHGSVVIAAVISCTNNCNPSAMLTAGTGSTAGTPPIQHLPPFLSLSAYAVIDRSAG